MVNKSIISLILIFSAIWPLSIFYNWPSDYGIYYSMGNLIDQDYRLYKEAFDTKGPAYFFFLKLIGMIIGKGVWQAYISLFITTLLYLTSLCFIINKFVKNDLKKIFLIILSVASLNYQDALSSIAIFQSALCIFSFYFLINSIEAKNIYSYVISTILLSLAIFTRVDAIIYTPVFFAIFIILLRNYQSKLKLIFLLSFSNFLVILFFLNFYSFSIIEFYEANIDHYGKFAVPSNIKTKLYILIYRTEQIIELFLQGIIPSFILIFGILIFNKLFKGKNFYNNKVALYLVLLGIMFSIYSESPSYRHANIFVTPILFFIIYSLENITIKNKYILLLPSIIFLIISINFNYTTTNKVFLEKCFKNIFCEGSKYKNSQKTIEEINKLKNVDVIGADGWIYVFTDAKPNLSIMNWNLYDVKGHYPTKYSIDQHNDLISKENRNDLWINKLILKNPTIYLNEVINHYQLVEDQGMFFKYEKSN